MSVHGRMPVVTAVKRRRELVRRVDEDGDAGWSFAWRNLVEFAANRWSFDLIAALWLGPANEYTRHWVAGRARRVPAAHADVLADAAWLTLKESA